MAWVWAPMQRYSVARWVNIQFREHRRPSSRDAPRRWSPTNPRSPRSNSRPSPMREGGSASSAAVRSARRSVSVDVWRRPDGRPTRRARRTREASRAAGTTARCRSASRRGTPLRRRRPLSCTASTLRRATPERPAVDRPSDTVQDCRAGSRPVLRWCASTASRRNGLGDTGPGDPASRPSAPTRSASPAARAPDRPLTFACRSGRPTPAES